MDNFFDQMPNQCCPPQNKCNVINKCFYEDVNHVYNCHTHVINTCIKRHHFIPKYTQSEETVVVDQCGNNMGFNNMGF